MKTNPPYRPYGNAATMIALAHHAPTAGCLACVVGWCLLALPSGLLSPIAHAAEVYSFESLGVNTFIDGQDGWKDQPGQGDAVVALDESGHGTKVVSHHKTVVFDQSAFINRTNDAGFNFLSFSGSETNAILQFEANGEHVAMFALGCDLNGDGVLTVAAGEIGPAFGVYDRNFRI